MMNKLLFTKMRSVSYMYIILFRITSSVQLQINVLVYKFKLFDNVSVRQMHQMQHMKQIQ